MSDLPNTISTSVLRRHKLQNYTTFSGGHNDELSLSYQLFGQPLHNAPIVLVNHALTGNSDVAGEERGWWKQLVGDSKLIDTSHFTVVAFNVPGNGYDGELLTNYRDFTAKDIARLFYNVLRALGVDELHAIIGGSLGGGITWEMAALYPDLAKFVIPIAADWKSTDWVIGHNSIQESILLNSKKPLQDARKMAMLLYRSPQSFTERFNRTTNEGDATFQVQSWLNHHGSTLENRFSLQAYLLMNHLLTTIDISANGKDGEEVLSTIKSKIIQISVSSDLLFIKDEIEQTKTLLDKFGVANEYYEIDSIDGHDAFLIEHDQIASFLEQAFTIDK